MERLEERAEYADGERGERAEEERRIWERRRARLEEGKKERQDEEAEGWEEEERASSLFPYDEDGLFFRSSVEKLSDIVTEDSNQDLCTKRRR